MQDETSAFLGACQIIRLERCHPRTTWGHPLDATNPIHEGYSFTVFECRKTHGGISHWDFAYVSRRRISTWPEVQSRLREKGEGKGDQNFTLAHHRCHQWSCRGDRAWDRIGIGESEQTMHLGASNPTRVTRPRGHLLLYDPSQQGLNHWDKLLSLTSS